MPTITSKADGAVLFYRDYSPSSKAPAFKPAETRGKHGKPALIFAAAWPFSSKMYDHLVVTLSESYGFRCICVDRRGYGGSQWSGAAKPGQDIDYDTFADDLAQVVEATGVTESDGFVGIGASLGCGEFVLALKRHPELLAACRGLIFLGPSLPIPLQTERKCTGPPRSFWDDLLERLRDDRYATLASSLEFVWGETGKELLSSAELRRYEDIATSADPIALERTILIFLDRDFTDLIEQEGRKFVFPILILHGDADKANPVETGPGFIQANVPNAKVVVYEGAAHGEWIPFRSRLKSY